MNIRILIGNIFGYLLLLRHKSKTCENKILSVYFHNPKKRVFEDCVTYLKAEKYKFLSIDELYSIISERKQVNGKNVFISLDDAWRENISNVIPCVEINKIPITVFTPVQPLKDGVLWLKWFRDEELIDKCSDEYPELKRRAPKNLLTAVRNNIWNKLRYLKSYPREIMTEADIQKLSKSPFITIEGHTMSHPILPKCDEKELDYELNASKEKLEALLGSHISYMAYPNGDYNDIVIEACRRYNYKMAFTTEQRMIDIQSDNLYKLPRQCVPNGYGKYETLARMLGLWNKMLRI